MKKFIVLMILIVMFSFISTSYAYTITYEPLKDQPHFTRIPTACAIIPNDPQLSQNQLDMMMDETKNRVEEWSSQLGAGSPHPHNWDIKYLQMTDSQYATSGTLCDITIIFRQKPDQTNTTQHIIIFGNEQYVPQLQTRFVRIFYMQYYYCQNSPSDYDTDKRCTSGIMPPLDMGNVILHEMGHALGMGHYVSDDQQLNHFWATNPTDAPSILVPFAKIVPERQFIQAIDIQKIHELYNYEGFTAFVQKNVNPFASLTANAYLTTINGDNTPQVAVSSQILSEYYSRGQRLEITITDAEGHQIYDQSFLTNSDFHETLTPQGLIPGSYTLNAIYIGMKSPDLVFYYSGESQQSRNYQQPPSAPSVTAPSNPPVSQTTGLVGLQYIQTDNTNYDVSSAGQDQIPVNVNGQLTGATSGQVYLQLVMADGNVQDNYSNVDTNGYFASTFELNSLSPSGTYHVKTYYENSFLSDIVFNVANSVNSHQTPSSDRFSISVDQQSGFTPNPITVPVGSTITWAKNDKEIHNIQVQSKTSSDLSSHTIMLDSNNPYGSYTFSHADTYRYYDEIHPSINSGTIIVGQQPTTSTPTMTVNTDKSSYSRGDTINISGKISGYSQEYNTNVIISNPNGKAWEIQATSGNDGTYSAKFTANDDFWNTSGTYTIKVNYADVSGSATIQYDTNQSSDNNSQDKNKGKFCFLFWCL